MLIRDTFVNNPHIRPVRKNVVVSSSVPVLEQRSQSRDRIHNSQWIPRHSRGIVSNVPCVCRRHQIALGPLGCQFGPTQDVIPNLSAQERDRYSAGPTVHYMCRGKRIISPEVVFVTRGITAAHDSQLPDLLGYEFRPGERRVRITSRLQQPGEVVEEANRSNRYARVRTLRQALAVQIHGLP